MTADTTESTQTEAAMNLLFVDDEANILSALKRLFRPRGYRIHTAGSGAAGLACLEENRIDLVISDMRMPEMDGAAFLQQVNQRWPGTVRVLLTGYADITSTIEAVNKGRIYHYISKPWEDNDILLTVQRGLEQRALEQERLRLVLLTQKQNRELRDLNTRLEDKVTARTSELQQTVSFLALANDNLDQSYRGTVEVFSHLIAMREHTDNKQPRLIAEQAGQLAEAMGMDAAERQQLHYAALLRNLGKLCLKDKLLTRPFSDLDETERETFTRHPLLGEGLLMALEPLQAATRLIRHQHEHVDGTGFPDHLHNADIPLGARILKVVGDFHDMQWGLLARKRFSRREARDFLLSHQNAQYDARVVRVFCEQLGHTENPAQHPGAHCVKSNGLREGMVLAQDLLMHDNVLLLARGHRLSEGLIARIARLEKSTHTDFDIYVTDTASHSA
ncbi:MAG TPA: response regulator [Gammaproteobacteria bacterium]|nr:response regulator [Gammaproteobacteria bacterium]